MSSSRPSAMNAYQRQLFGAQTFLEYTLDHRLAVEQKRLLIFDNVRVELWDNGVLYFHPQAVSSPDSILLSVGVHGDETAPIEIVDRLVSNILSGKTCLKHNLLVVIANPPAISAGSRQVDENMNRLFNNRLHQKNKASAEHRRSIDLMGYSKDFFNRDAKHKLHYDLHTAIRDSAYEVFAISPNISTASLVEQQYSTLAQWGIEAILSTDKNNATYSAFTARYCAAISFTLELGKVKPFGENDLDKLSAVITGLDRLVSGAKGPVTEAKKPRRFRVITQIYKRSKDFQLCFPPATANFSEFANGELLAVDTDYQYRVAGDGERILFPNENVAIGQRALVIVRPLDN